MREDEAKKLITKFCEDRTNFARGKDMSDKELEDFCEFSDALTLSISSLEEIQQYRAIGTVEECREAVNKQKEMTTKSEGQGYESEDYCPVCGENLGNSTQLWVDHVNYCRNCGQRVESE